jgi:hypothetical protein
VVTLQCRDDAYNQQLSEARAKSVFQYLVDRGIDQEDFLTRDLAKHSRLQVMIRKKGGSRTGWTILSSQ